MKPELYLTDALGAAGKPMFRVHTAGSVGGTTGIVASHLVETGRHRRVLAVALREAVGGQRAVRARLAAAARRSAPAARSRRSCARYIQRTGAPEHIGRMVAVKDRQNALKNPYAHLQDRRHLDREGEGVADDVGPGALPRVVPVVRRRVRGRASPTRRAAKAAAADGRPPAWILGVGRALGAVAFPGRDPVRPQGAVDCARRRLRAGRHHRPARADRLRRALRAVQLVRADVARGARHRRARPRAGRWSSAATPRSTARSR